MKSTTLTSVLLPTEDASILCLGKSSDKLELLVKPATEGQLIKPHHLHLCSSLPIKLGDWYVYENCAYKCGINHSPSRDYFRIEFTTDPLLIKDGVPSLDGNTSATKSELDVIFRVNFLEEFCLRYNQKDNEKAVDVDDLAESLALERRNVQAYTEEYCEGVKDGFEEGFKASQALQSCSGGYSFEDLNKVRLWCAGLHGNEFKTLDELAQSLTKSSPSNPMVIEMTDRMDPESSKAPVLRFR